MRVNSKRSSTLLGVVVSVLTLSACATSPGMGERPRPTSQQDAVVQAKACMSEKGWEVEIIDGATSADVPDAQMDSYLQAVSECSEALGFTTPRELTEEELATAFESQLANRSCLVALGFDLPEGPSLQSYVDEQGYWTPYADLPEVSDAVLAELERECPQYQLW